MQNRLLILILQTITLFPNQEIKLELSNELSKKIIKRALTEYNGDLIVVSPKEENKIVSSIKDIQNIGAFSKVKNVIDLPNGNVRITLRGIKRVKLTAMSLIDDELIEVSFNPIDNPVYNLDEELAYSRKLKELVARYISINSLASNSVLGIIKNATNLSKITDMISASLDFNPKQKFKLFKESDYYKRARMLITMLNNEIMSLELENKIEEEVRLKFDKNEKEIIIREKIKVLSDEIGLGNDKQVECEKFLSLIDSFKIDEKIKERMKNEVKRFEMTLDSSPEYGSLRAHLEFITSLPWNKSSKEESDIKKIDDKLNELHYGLEQAKERIEEYLALRKKKKNVPSPVLCLIGPPGTGKTTFARELAGSVHREFVKVSVGGLNDASELVGHRRTYIAAGAGKIMEGIRKCGVNNPIILIDEVDKIVKDYKGDPSGVLLEILDQTQNREFVDNYVQEPFDLSNVLFILTANDESKIPRALYDRLEVMEVASYTVFDKIEIAKNYTLPRLGKNYGFDFSKIKMSDGVIAKIVEDYTREAGMRDLERKISSIVRKILIDGLDSTVTIKESDLIKYLGPIKYKHVFDEVEEVGVVNVPACSTMGGCIFKVEASIYSGPERIISTGSLGKIMQESTLVSLSYIKAYAKELKVDAKKMNATLHIHALDGSVPKEGPSAGLGITVAILSELLEKCIPKDTAFTGEMSLKGRILKVGGLKDKIISAYNMGIKRIFIPVSNEDDLKTIPKKILKSVEIIHVETFTEVYNEIFK